MNFETNRLLIKLLSKRFSNWGFTIEGIKDNRKGEWWLFAQVLVLLAHIIPPWPVITTWPIILRVISIIVFIYGLYRSYLAIITLGDNLSPLPEPKESAILVKNSVYSSCRHPLYQSLIYISLSLFSFTGSLLHFLLLIILTIVLINKAKVEEKRLRLKYKEYNIYISTTPAIFNGVIFLDWRN